METRRRPLGFLDGGRDQPDQLVQIVEAHRLNGRALAQTRAWCGQGMVDAPGFGSAVELEQCLDQGVLGGIKVPVRHALPTVADVQCQQVARFDLIADPAAGLARQFSELRYGEIVGASKRSTSAMRCR